MGFRYSAIANTRIAYLPGCRLTIREKPSIHDRRFHHRKPSTRQTLFTPFAGKILPADLLFPYIEMPYTTGCEVAIEGKLTYRNYTGVRRQTSSVLVSALPMLKPKNR